MINKKSLFIMLVLFIILFSHIVFATDINISSENTNNTDNTIYTAVADSSSAENVSADASVEESQPATVSYTDYPDSTELSLSNMINIVLIAVGVVLILLAIAILIKIK